MRSNQARSYCRACKCEASEVGPNTEVTVNLAEYQVIGTVELPGIVTPVPTRRNLCKKHFEQAVTPHAGVVIKSVLNLKSGKPLVTA